MHGSVQRRLLRLQQDDRRRVRVHERVRRHSVHPMKILTRTRRTWRAVAALAVAFGFLVASCGSDVAAFECAANAKLCTVAGKPTCVALDDPKYGCASP